MLASDKQYVKNKTRMRDNLRRQESGSIRNNSGKMRNIPSRSSMGPSIVRDDSDEDATVMFDFAANVIAAPADGPSFGVAASGV